MTLKRHLVEVLLQRIIYLEPEGKYLPLWVDMFILDNRLNLISGGIGVLSYDYR